MRPAPRLRARRGFALIDYIVGTLILSATLITITSLNTMKIRAQGMASRRQMANFTAANLLDRIRETWAREPAAKAAVFAAAAESGEAWAPVKTALFLEGFAEKKRFEAIVIEARRVGGLDVGRYIELRLSLRWRDGVEKSELWQTSTLIARGGGGKGS